MPTFAQLDILNVCVECHSADKFGEERRGAPRRINYTSYILATAELLAQRGAIEVINVRMPPPDLVIRPNGWWYQSQKLGRVRYEDDAGNHILDWSLDAEQSDN